MAGHGDGIAVQNGRDDVTRRSGFYGDAPEFFAVLGTVADHIGGGDHYNLFHAGELAAHQAGVSGIVGATFPNKVASFFLKANEAGAGVPAGGGINIFGIGDRLAVVAVATGGGAAAAGGVAAKPFGAKIFGVVFFPKQFAAVHRNASEHARGALAKEQVAINERRSARAGAVHVGVLPRGGVRSLPNDFASGAVDGGGGFPGLHVHGSFMQHDKRTLGEREAALAFADGDLPKRGGLGREIGEGGFAVKNAIAIRAAPLRPITGGEGKSERESKASDGIFHRPKFVSWALSGQPFSGNYGVAGWASPGLSTSPQSPSTKCSMACSAS